jgi:hypothetical protein
MDELQAGLLIRFDGNCAALPVPINRTAHRRVGPATEFDYLRHAIPFAMPPHDLLTPLVQLLQCLGSRIFFPYLWDEVAQNISSIIVPDQKTGRSSCGRAAASHSPFCGCSRRMSVIQ